MPKKLCHNIMSSMAKFWWNYGKKEKKYILKKMENMGSHKSCGGLGFKDLFVFNQTLLAKQAWRILSKPNLLVSTMLRCKYFSNGSVFDAKVGTRPSFLWYSLVSFVTLVKECLFWSIGNDCHTKIWGDN